MKLRKTRIRVETKSNGSVWYTPEYKYGWWLSETMSSLFDKE